MKTQAFVFPLALLLPLGVPTNTGTGDSYLETLTCVVQSDGKLRDVPIRISQATGDTLDIEFNRPFPEIYQPTYPPYAAESRFFIENQPVQAFRRKYVKFGLSRTLRSKDLKRAAYYNRVPAYAASTESLRVAPEILYLPVRPGCEFQAYQYEAPIHAVRG